MHNFVTRAGLRRRQSFIKDPQQTSLVRSLKLALGSWPRCPQEKVLMQNLALSTFETLQLFASAAEHFKVFCCMNHLVFNK